MRSTTGARKEKVGRVVSDRMDKTIVVSVERLSRHRVYKRVVRLTTKFKAHDEDNDAHVGDTVRIEESRPLSATKRWRLVEVLQRAGEGAGEPLVSEEEATSEVIHMAAHPGRREAAEREAAAAREAGGGVAGGAAGTPGQGAATGAGRTPGQGAATGEVEEGRG
jgi:small subunit ribosomal protein S17